MLNSCSWVVKEEAWATEEQVRDADELRKLVEELFRGIIDGVGYGGSQPAAESLAMKVLLPGYPIRSHSTRGILIGITLLICFAVSAAIMLESSNIGCMASSHFSRSLRFLITNWA